MKNKIVAVRFLLLLAILSAAAAVALAGEPAGTGQSGREEPAGRVDISFDYAKLRGFASNQFAVWVETEQGEYVRSIFVTEWTPKGGWQKRPLALATWVKSAKVQEIDQYDINAFSGPTPKAGRMEYSWDCTHRDKPVPDGRYRIRIEGTLRNENVVLLDAVVEVGGPSRTAEIATEFLGEETKDRGMIRNAKVEYVSN